MTSTRKRRASRVAKAIIFDIGGVLAPGAGRMSALSDHLADRGVSVDLGRLESAYWEHRDAYDLGQDDDGYWRAVLEQAQAEVPQGFDYAGIGEFDGRRNAQIVEESRQLLTAAQQTGATLGILSNAPASMSRAVRHAEWSACCEVMVFSHEVGIAKPDPSIYRIIEDELADHHGCTFDSAEILFIDDRPMNTAAAAELGWNPHKFTSVEEALRFITEQGNQNRKDLLNV